MAGSKSWFRYTDDSGTDYSVFLDESNSEATIGGARLLLSRTAAYPLLRKGIKLRYCNAFLTSNPDIKRRFYLGNAAAVAQVFTGANIVAGVYADPTDAAAPAGVNWTVTSYRGEEQSIPPAVSATSGDTGLTDGDPGRDG